MLTPDELKIHIDARKVLIKHPCYNPYRTPFLDSYRADIYPIGQDYYHELNPFTIMNLENIDYLNDYKLFTLRDGAVTLADFLLHHVSKLARYKSHFLISPDHAKLIPEQLKDNFSCWSHGHLKNTTIQDSEKIFIFALAGDEILPPLQDIKKKLLDLKEQIQHQEILLFLSHRKSPFQTEWKESTLTHELVDLIKTTFPRNKIKYLKIKEVLNINSWHRNYCLDLFENTLIHSDNYLNHFIAARGGTIQKFTSPATNDLILKMPLSLFHEIRILPLPKVKSIFPEILFYKKKYPQNDLLMDPIFYQLLKDQYSQDVP